MAAARQCRCAWSDLATLLSPARNKCAPHAGQLHRRRLRLGTRLPGISGKSHSAQQWSNRRPKLKTKTQALAAKTLRTKRGIPPFGACGCLQSGLLLFLLSHQANPFNTRFPTFIYDLHDASIGNCGIGFQIDRLVDLAA